MKTPRKRFELLTHRLTADCSATELSWIELNNLFKFYLSMVLNIPPGHYNVNYFISSFQFWQFHPIDFVYWYSPFQPLL